MPQLLKHWRGHMLSDQLQGARQLSTVALSPEDSQVWQFGRKSSSCVALSLIRVCNIQFTETDLCSPSEPTARVIPRTSLCHR